MKKCVLASTILGLTLVGCGGGGSSSGSPDNTDSAPKTAPVSFSVTDAPIDDAVAVELTVTAIKIKGTPLDVESDSDTEETDDTDETEETVDTDEDESGDDESENDESENEESSFETYELDEPFTVDLLELQGSASEPLIDDIQLIVGEYDEVRLVLSSNDGDNVIRFDDGREVPLQTPSAQTSGLKLKGGFTVAETGSDFTIDFDLRKSIVSQGNGGFLLKPVVRIIDNTVVGSIAGTVDPNACGDAVDTSADALVDKAAIYVFEGADIEPFEYSAEASPLTSALLKSEEGEDGITYEVGFLAAGDYTIALACNADQDDVEATDNSEETTVITFAGTTTVSVEADNETTQNIEAPVEGEEEAGTPVLPILP